MYDVLFFTNVLRLLDERTITKQQLADHAGISTSFLSDFTNGKANPSLKVLESIATALDVPLKEGTLRFATPGDSVSITVQNCT